MGCSEAAGLLGWARLTTTHGRRDSSGLSAPPEVNFLMLKLIIPAGSFPAPAPPDKI